jgi:uncharacterized damage-inducible protein DinB
MRSVRLLAGLMAVCALSLSSTTVRVSAQAAPATQAAGTDATIASVKTLYEAVKGFVTKAAAMVPEDKYKYQPTKEVRTMGALFGHVANATAMFCNTASGMQMPMAGDAEKLASKAEIQKAMATAFSACDHAFQMINAGNANEGVKLFGQSHTRIGAMAFNNAHIYEHYGNIVTYMRINGMVPPSSGGK